MHYYEFFGQGINYVLLVLYGINIIELLKAINWKINKFIKEVEYLILNLFVILHFRDLHKLELFHFLFLTIDVIKLIVRFITYILINRFT